MVDHNLEISSPGEIDQLLSLLGIAREWLFDEHVLAVLQSGFCQFVVRPNWGNDGDSVDLRRRNHISGVWSYLNPRIRLLRAFSCGSAHLRDSDHFRTL